MMWHGDIDISAHARDRYPHQRTKCPCSPHSMQETFLHAHKFLVLAFQNGFFPAALSKSSVTNVGQIEIPTPLIEQLHEGNKMVIPADKQSRAQLAETSRKKKEKGKARADGCHRSAVCTLHTTKLKASRNLHNNPLT